MNQHTPTPLAEQQLDKIEAKAAELRERLDRKNPWPSDNESHWTAEGWKAGTRNALDKLDPAALVAEVRRLRATPSMECINCETPVGWVDCPTGGWWAHETHPTDGHGADPRPAAVPAAVETGETCGKCKQPFDPNDTRFDGHARHRDTPYCRRCVDRCHDNEIADHRCVICA